MQFPLIILTFIAISNDGINAKPPTKIVGGKRVDITEAPFVVMFRHRLSHNSTHALICGGTIITRRHIITAAHCFRRNETSSLDLRHPEWFDVIAGEDFYHSNANIYKIRKAYFHPNYTYNVRDGDNDRADLVVVKLKDKISFSPIQNRITMISKEPASFSKGFAYGWGVINPNKTDTLSHTLQGMIMKIYSFSKCKKDYPDLLFSPDELCVIALSDGALCYGDSGGPFTVNGKLAGVISSSVSCITPTLGTVVNIAHHKSWIEDVVNGRAEARMHFTMNNTHDKQISRPSKKQKRPILQDELSSRYPLLMTSKYDNSDS